MLRGPKDCQRAAGHHLCGDDEVSWRYLSCFDEYCCPGYRVRIGGTTWEFVRFDGLIIFHGLRRSDWSIPRRTVVAWSPQRATNS